MEIMLIIVILVRVMMVVIVILVIIVRLVKLVIVIVTPASIGVSWSPSRASAAAPTSGDEQAYLRVFLGTLIVKFGFLL